VTLPSPAALAAFAPGSTPVKLDGGQGQSFRAGDLVLKPAGLSDEAEWSAATFERLAGGGFRVPRPVRSPAGAVVVDGWTAWTWLEGEPAGRNGGRWSETLAACEAFHAALADVPRPEFLDRRTDPWSVADRMAFGEVPMGVSAEVEPVAAELVRLVEPVTLRSQVIHGDFTGNVLFADGLPPGVIDFSPYWRPAAFAAAVIAADGLTWGGMRMEELRLFEHVPGFRPMLVRAFLRRLLECDLHNPPGHRHSTFGQELRAHRAAIEKAAPYLAR
jgi:uncharacterized protein (TIGR02569 family)